MSDLPDRICIWEADENDPNSTRGWTVSFPENHLDIYIRASLNTRPAAPVEGLDRYDLSMFGNGIVEMGGGAYVRPAPAATDTGLVTVGVQYAHEHSITGRAMWGWQKEWKGCSAIGTRELVTRSQAEAIIAAKDATLQDAIDCVKVLTDEKNKFEADNAALTARAKELEADVSAYILSAEDQDKRRKALETQLAAAKEREEHLVSLLKAFTSQEDREDPELRAALEAKP